MASLKLKPNGDVLRWARETSRKTIEKASKEMKVSEEQVTLWETEKEPVTLAQLKKLSKLYKRNLAVFFLPNEPKEGIVSPVFRTFDSVKTEDLSDKTLVAFRKAKRGRKTYINLLENLKENYKFDFPRVSIHSNPAEFALNVRRLLGVSSDVHSRLENKGAALKYWISLLESRGLLVFQFSLPERGFCLSQENGLPPVIVLSSSEEPGGRIFTIFHELCHLLIEENPQQISHKTLEKFCNHFAGAFLVPEKTLRESFHFSHYCKELSDAWPSRLAGEFKVSEVVILRRLLILDEIQESFYNQKVREIERRYKNKKNAKEKKGQTGFPQPARRSVMNAGTIMTKKLFEAYNAEVVNMTNLVTALGTTSVSLGQVKDELKRAQNIKYKNG